VITAEELQRSPPFAALPEQELAGIAARAADVQLGAGEWLIQEGELLRCERTAMAVPLLALPAWCT
jgi:hypothetical protein